VQSGQEVFEDLKYNTFFTMSSSATTYFSNGTSGNSTSNTPLGYWSNQNYHFYQHYAYQNGGGIVQQFPYQQHHGTTERGETVYQPHESENSLTHAPTEDQNATNMLAPNTKYSTNLPPISYTIVGLNQQQVSRKPISSPSSQQSGLHISDECFTNRYILNSSPSMYQSHYQQTNNGLRSPESEARNIQIARSPSPRRPDHNGSFPSSQQPVFEVKKESTSPILGMLLSRPSVPKVSPSANQSASYQEFYSPSPSGATVPEFTNKDGSAEERDVALRHQYGVDAGTSTSSKTIEGEEVASRQGFRNSTPPHGVMEFPHRRFENRKLTPDCMQPVIPYSVDSGGGAKITSQMQQNSFYPWMKSYTGEFSQMFESKI
jgi:hypothetical protein